MARIFNVNRPRNDAGATLAWCDAEVRDVLIHGCRIMRARSGTIFLSMPSRKREGRDGKSTWEPIVELSRADSGEMNRLASEAILEG